MNNNVTTLQSCFCPYGYSDIKAICEIGDEVSLNENELFDVIEENRQELGYTSWDNFDPVYSVLDHVMQQARNKISDITGYDFSNDFTGSGEIYAYGNYMCSGIDYSTEAVDELVEKTSEDVEELLDDEYCRYLFSQLEIHQN